MIKRSLKKNVLLAGSGRSGTTWLMELLNYPNNYRLVFEPFKKKYSPDWQKTKREKPFLNNDDDFKDKEVVRQLLLGKISNDWTNKIKGSRWSSKVLVKEIRLNYMLGWLQVNFPELKIVYIVRDPYSVAFSGSEWSWRNYPIARALPSERFAKRNLSDNQLEILKQADSLFQKNIATWALENYLALKNAQRNDNLVGVYYETLARQPETELKRLANFCGHRFDRKVLGSTTMKSKLAKKDSVTDPNAKQFGRRWQGKISREDEVYAEKVLKAFGLDKLYKQRNVPAFDQPFELRLK